MGFGKALGMFAAAVFALSLVSNAAAEAPNGVMVVYGTVTIDGRPAPAGVAISATLNGQVVDSTMTGGNEQPTSGYRLEVQTSPTYENQKGKLTVAGAQPAVDVTFQANTALKVDLTVTSGGAQPTAVPLGHPKIDENMVAKPYLGDLDGDRVVDFKDLGRLMAAYGLKAGDLAFEAAADLDKDGSVDVKDLALLGANYGKTY